MSIKSLILRNTICSLMAVLLGAQPVFAATYQYNVFVKGFQPKSQPGGPGNGEVDPGDDPVWAAKPAPVLQLSPGNLRFVSRKGQPLSSHTSLLTNVGTAAANLAGISSSFDFTATSDCPSVLEVDASCVLTVLPTNYDEVEQKLVITASGAKKAAVLGLSTASGTDKNSQSSLLVNPQIVSLGQTLAPGDSVSGTATVTNGGPLPLSLGGIVSKEHFAVSSDCPSILAIGASCSISAEFSATNPDSYQHSLALTSGPHPEAVPLTFFARIKGNAAATPRLSLDTAVLDFPESAAGVISHKAALLTNTGTAVAHLAGISAPAPFSVQSDCTADLAPNASCTIDVALTAPSEGASPNYLISISAQDEARADLALLGHRKPADGPGQRIRYSPELLTFEDTPLGQSLTKQVRVTNDGTLTASVRQTAVRNNPDYLQTNNCGAAIAPGASCVMTVTFTPTSTYIVPASIVMTLTDGTEAVFAAQGEGLNAALTAGPATVDFGAVSLQSETTRRRIFLGNKGNTPVRALTASMSAPGFKLESTTCLSDIAPAEGCEIVVGFTPNVLGAARSQLVLSSNAGGRVTLNLTAAVVQLDVAPSNLVFEKTAIGAVTSPQAIVLTNRGPESLPWDYLGVPDDSSGFSQTNNCGTALASGASCQVSVRYRPANEGTNTRQFSAGAFSTQIAQVNMTGSGVKSGLLLSTNVLNFGDVLVGKTSNMLSMTVTNASSKTVAIRGAGLATEQNMFGYSNNCGRGLAPGEQCTINAQFIARESRYVEGLFGIDSDIGLISFSMTGTGVVPDGEIDDGSPSEQPSAEAPDSDGFTHRTIKFLATDVGTSSAVRGVLFRNTGKGPLTVQGISVVAGMSDFGQSNNCGEVIAPGEFCTISLLFTPTVGGPRIGGIAVLSDGGKFYFDLTGVGAVTSGVWASTSTADFGQLDLGSSVDRSFTFSNNGTATARKVYVELPSTALSFVNNTCGTVAAPVEIDPEYGCVVTLRYAPTVAGTLAGTSLKAFGTNLAANPAMQALTGSAALSLSGTPLSTISGDVGGGTPITVSGKNFSAGMSVYFDKSPATSVNVVSSRSLTAIIPPATSAGPVDVSIADSAGGKAISSTKYTYTDVLALTSGTPMEGATEGGTPVTLKGEFLGNRQETFLFGDKPATVLSWAASTNTVVVSAPPGVVGRVAVRVALPGRIRSLAASYEYFVPVSVSAWAYNGVSTSTTVSLPETGGGALTISGTGFDSTTLVYVGAGPAIVPTQVSSTALTIVAPVGIAGTKASLMVATGTHRYTATDAITFVEPALESQSVTVASNQVGFNLNTYLGAPTVAKNFIVTINSGVVLSSTLTTVAAFDTGTLPSGSRVTLINNGAIIGMGGNGGPAAIYGTDVGRPGGPAISLRTKLSLDNTSGYLYGGGGGGGSGTPLGGNGSGGDGGGGAGGGINGGNCAGWGYSTFCNPGQPGTNGLAGKGGVGGISVVFGVSAGAGGEYGQAGTWAPGGGAGGAPGSAILSNGYRITIVGGNNDAQIKGAVN